MCYTDEDFMELKKKIEPYKQIFADAFVKGHEVDLQDKDFVFSEKVIGKYDLEKGLKCVWEDTFNDCDLAIDKAKKAIRYVLRKHGLKDDVIERLITVVSEIMFLYHTSIDFYKVRDIRKDEFVLEDKDRKATKFDEVYGNLISNFAINCQFICDMRKKIDALGLVVGQMLTREKILCWEDWKKLADDFELEYPD